MRCGAHSVAFTTSESKRADALALGADEVIVSRNTDEMQAHGRSFDLIINTVSASHDLDVFVDLLKRDGTMAMCGVPDHPHPAFNVGGLVRKTSAILRVR
jgi:uncharacterized zinc-type alcohol dehydrogenase-like protein